MLVFIDTVVLLDVWLGREPHLESSGALLDWAESNPGMASVSWHGLANLHYLSAHGAESFIRELLVFCVIPPAGTTEMLRALKLGFKDLEDAMQTAVALRFGAQVIATRNTRNYRKSPISVKTPKELLREFREFA